MSESPSPETETEDIIEQEETSEKEETLTDNEQISEEDLTDNEEMTSEKGDESENEEEEDATENNMKSEKTMSENMLERDEITIEKEDMMSMFASVWVKVEVEEAREEELQIDEGPERPKRKHRSKKHLKNLVCDQCDYRTAYKNCLELHILSHKQGKGFACHVCDYKSKYPTALQRHIAIRHYEMNGDTPMDNGKPLPLHQCPDCDYKTFYKWNLNSHKRKHKLIKQFKCPSPDCNFETAYRHNYIKHSKVHKESVAFKCDKCPFTTRFEGHITRHLAKIHNEVTEKANKCDLCDFSTKTRWRLKIHVNRMKKEQALKCSFCEFETFFTCAYKKHKVDHYNEIYINPKRTKNTLSAEQQHIKDIQDKMQETPEIDLTFHNYTEKNMQYIPSEPENHNKYNLDPNCVDWNNIQVLETDDKERPFQCHMCAYTSKFKASVQRHFQRHHTGSHNRPYKCVNCDFSTKTKDQIALHNKRSLSDIRLFCNICKFQTSYKCQFVMHQKCHYAYKCTACNYSCKHKYELQRHYGIMHLGNGIKCRFCEYKASRKDSVLCHETIHTGMKPFKCEYCDYTSIRKSLLDNHVKRYHSDIKKDITIVSESKIESLKIPLVLREPIDFCKENQDHNEPKE
ncbi:zinc finger protein 761-like [Cydia splendana]|uniref:zinc finger protein 761-like n=1 Tax=Cydia splendana TaxID=1100963 RepID=UPI00300C65DD